ncbi:MAG: hypothetical protein WCI11_20960, partial [Candidatus Methylumidiphilus sp.]
HIHQYLYTLLIIFCVSPIDNNPKSYPAKDARKVGNGPIVLFVDPDAEGLGVGFHTNIPIIKITDTLYFLNYQCSHGFGNDGNITSRI